MITVGTQLVKPPEQRPAGTFTLKKRDDVNFEVNCEDFFYARHVRGSKRQQTHAIRALLPRRICTNLDVLTGELAE